MANRRPSVISLFSGALGLDLGLERAGFRVAVAVECNRHAAATIRHNRPRLHLIEQRLECVPTAEILGAAGFQVGEATVVTGGPSCQAFSTAGNRLSVRDPRGTMFRAFLRVVREARPEFFVLENVRGILSAAIRHRPLNERGPGFPRLRPDEELGSALGLILRALRSTGYHVAFYVLNAADFGVPQARERVVFVGSRDGRPFDLPLATHSREGGNGTRNWRTLRAALKGLREKNPDYPELPPSKTRFLRLIPAGGNWRDLPPRLRPAALGAAYRSWGGRNGFYRRLSWSRPAPALTTRPDCRATMFCHPTKLRPLSVREYARIQEFPDDWDFIGPRSHHYTQIGNAVPLGLGEAIGHLILQARVRRRRRALLGKVVCPDASLLERLERRPRTVLNPKRMRRVKSTRAARGWMPAKRRRLAKLFHLPNERGVPDAKVGTSGVHGRTRLTDGGSQRGLLTTARAGRFGDPQ